MPGSEFPYRSQTIRRGLQALLGVVALGTFVFGAEDEEEKPFQLVPGEFPPADTATYIAGELIGVDHVNRTGVLRVDRTDAQRRGDWDLPHAFILLPYHSIYYHGAPAELRDIPLGTHMHGQFFHKPEKEIEPGYGEPSLPEVAGKISKENAFNRCLMLEDDFSYHTRRKQAWKIQSIDLETKKITAELVGEGVEKGAKPSMFDYTPATRYWKGNGFAKLEDLAPGQTVQVNLTWATLFGPGRLTDVWIDEEARGFATSRQMEIHRQFYLEHGFPGWVTKVDNAESLVTIELFAGFDPELKKAFVEKQSATGVVAESSLRSYDQVNDRKSGNITRVETVENPAPGSSGLLVTFKPGELLEGFRPQRIVRLFPPNWKVESVPLEYRLWPVKK